MMILAVVWISQDAGQIDPTHVTGTFLKPAGDSAPQWLNEKVISEDWIQGNVSVVREVSHLAVILDITPASPIRMAIRFEAAKIIFRGFTYNTVSPDSLTQIPGRIDTWHQGHMAGTVVFEDRSQTASEVTLTFISEDREYQEVIAIPAAGR
jgi:hypothetical protein